MSLEDNENKIFKDYVIQKVQSIKNLRMSIPFEEREYKYAKIRCDCSI